MYYFTRRYTEFSRNGIDIIETLMISKLYIKIGSIGHARWFDSSGNLNELSDNRYILDLPIDLRCASPCNDGYCYSDTYIRKKAILDVISKGIITPNKVWKF